MSAQGSGLMEDDIGPNLLTRGEVIRPSKLVLEVGSEPKQILQSGAQIPEPEPKPRAT